MNRLLSIAIVSTMVLAASPVMAERYHDYRNYDRGQRYSGHSNYSNHSNSHSSWGVSVGVGFSNYNSFGGASFRYGNYSGYNNGYGYRPVYNASCGPRYYAPAPVTYYRTYAPAPCATYYAPAPVVYAPVVYDTGDSYCSTPRYYNSGGYANITYSSGGGGYYRGSYYSNYDCPSSYYSGSVSYRYGR